MQAPRYPALLFAASLTLSGAGTSAVEPHTPPVVLLPSQALAADQLAVIVNDLDPLSRRIADYYAEKRRIRPAHLIRVRLPPGQSQLDVAEFRRIYAQVIAATPNAVQAYVLTWAAPYRVDCMSITTAFATGDDPPSAPPPVPRRARARCTAPTPAARSRTWDGDPPWPWQGHPSRR